MLLLVAGALAAPHVSPSSATKLLSAVEAHLSHDGSDACLTPLVNELKHRAAELTLAERAWATAALMPWKADLLDPVAPIHTTPPPPVPTEPCFTLGENRITSAHFAVELDEGTISESTAKDFL